MISQAADVQSRFTFRSGFAKERVEFWSALWVGEQCFPAVILLPGRKEARKVGDLSPLAGGQSFANQDEFFRFGAHEMQFRRFSQD